ncbi:helix-turn-helix transcriptional regulator [Paenibacillus beijingensis]|uniref:AraC family transcriptional regulator n=1 Tax=Paenibacillus beijingensis TaxID=1126833 RepID=A0A0D5NHT0_9BACL|nr:AraC family transcriptional regulator [Paenibacillus beijingensis]AJY74826.1 AraC family transcriptional regulator [Paenibacillus beijingensis]
MSFQQLVSLIPSFERVEFSQTTQTIASPAGCHLMIIVLHGHLSVSGDNEEAVMVSQGFACHPRYSPFTIQVPKTKKAEYAVISYRMFPENSPWTLQGPLRTVSEVKIKYMLDELFQMSQDPGNLSEEEQLVQQIRKRLILERILFIYMYETGWKQETPSSSGKIEESLSYINKHYMLKLTLPMLAERAGISVGHYTTLFKNVTGTTMSRYLRTLRIDKAKQIFRQTRLPAKEVAQLVGFADYFHFSRTFKQEVGCAPAAFLKTLDEIE